MSDQPSTSELPRPLRQYGGKYINVSRVAYAERRGTRLWIYFAGGSSTSESLTFSSATETFLDGEEAERFLRENAGDV